MQTRRQQSVTDVSPGSVRANLVCDLNHPGGFGTHARSFASALSRRLPIAIMHIGATAPLGEGVPPMLTQAATRPLEVDQPSIWIGPILPVPNFPGNPRIGWITWETTKIPSVYRDALTQYDFLWTPSTFCKCLLESNLRPCPPVSVVPEGIDPDVFFPLQAHQSEKPRPFRFLTVGKWEKRKGHDCLLRAFLRTFSGRNDVELVLRLTVSSKDTCSTPTDLNDILSVLRPSGYPPVRLTPTGDVATLAECYRDAHAFVLSTRAEAWGLPILEAMSSGLPCIVTKYGGHLDYCNEDNVFFVQPRALVPAHDPIYFPPTHDWGEWAEPDTRRLGTTMYKVWNQYQYACHRGQVARESVSKFWTWEHSAQIAEQILYTI
jgi:glycosyltransferase involved in cell wall biosynthesis